MTPSRRFSFMAVAGTLITLVAVTLPTTGWSAGAATSCAGVTVVVDFTHFGGNIERGCAPNPSSGLDALHQAGFTTAGTTQYGDAFLCRIDNLPGPADEPCTSTPSATAYWAYYHAQPNDGGWTYSPIGATSTHPAAGSVEGYAFGARALPGVAPKDAALPSPPTTTRAGPTPTTTASSPGASTPLAISPSRGGEIAITPTGQTPTTPTTSRARTDKKSSSALSKKSKRSTHATSTTVEQQNPPIVDRSGVASAPTRKPSSGSPVALIVALVLVGVGTGIGVSFVRARRRGSL
jgi:hypothetical protein